MHIQYQQRGRSSRAVRSGWKSVALASLLAMVASSAAWAADCRVTPDGTGDGSSWEQATNLHAALANANCSALWLREGTYKPVSDADSQAAVDAYAASKDTGVFADNKGKYFAVTRPVQIYGGFSGTETALPDRNSVNAAKTVLSGDIHAPSTQAELKLRSQDEGDGSVWYRYDVIPPLSLLPGATEDEKFVDNSKQILVIGRDANGNRVPYTYTAANMVLDGLTFDGSVEQALVCDGAGPGSQCGLALNNVVVQNTSGSLRASGLWVMVAPDTDALDLQITKSKFVNNLNKTTSSGAAIAITGTGRQASGDVKEMVASVKIDQTEFRKNATLGGASVFYVSDAIAVDLQLSNSIFADNQSGKWGSSVAYVVCKARETCKGKITNSLFENNYAAGGTNATAIYWSAGELAVSQSTFRNNRSYGVQGGKVITAGYERYALDDTAEPPVRNTLTLSVENSTFDSNEGDADGIALAYLFKGDKVRLQSNTLLNNTALPVPISELPGNLGGGQGKTSRAQLLALMGLANDAYDASVEVTNNIVWNAFETQTPLVAWLTQSWSIAADPALAPSITLKSNVSKLACDNSVATVQLFQVWDNNEPQTSSWEQTITPFAPTACDNMVNGDPVLTSGVIKAGAKQGAFKVGLDDSPVPVLLLGPGSSALDAAAPGTATDQRGINRAALGGAAPDIGAVEMRYATLAMAVTGSGQVTGSGAAPATGGVAGCTNADPAQCQAVYYLESATPPQVTLTASPQAGFGLVAWAGACASAGSATTATVSLTEAATCQARFAALASIVATTATAGTGGAVSPADQQVVSGESASYTLAPNAGYEVDTSQVGGTCAAGSWSGNTYTTGPVTQDCAVSFVFKAAGTGPVDPGNPGNPGSVQAVPVPVMESAGLLLLSGLLGAAAAVTSRRRQRKAAK